MSSSHLATITKRRTDAGSKRRYHSELWLLWLDERDGPQSLLVAVGAGNTPHAARNMARMWGNLMREAVWAEGVQEGIFDDTPEVAA